MARKSRVDRLAEEFGIDAKAVSETLTQMPGRPSGPPVVGDEHPPKPAPDWAAYRETVQAAGLDVGSPLRSPRTAPPNACKACGSAKTERKCTSGCDGLLARVVPQSVGRGRRAR